MFPGIVETVQGADAADAAIGALLSDPGGWRKRSAAGIDAVVSGHTYADRLASILTIAGVEFEPDEGGISLLVPSDIEPRAVAGMKNVAEVLVRGSNDGRDWGVPVVYAGDSGEFDREQLRRIPRCMGR